MKKYISKKFKIIVSVLLAFSLSVVLVPCLKLNTKADTVMTLNTDYVIDGLSQADAIAAVACAQVGRTGMELGAVEGWCGDFIYTCAVAAGIGSDIIPYTGSPIDMFNGILANGGTIVTDDVKAGDIAYYPNSGEAGHVGLIVGPDTIINGNTGSDNYFLSYVYETYFSTAEDVIVVRPAYSADAVTVSDSIAYIASLPYSGVPDTYYFEKYMPREEEQFAASGLGWYIDDFNVLNIYGNGSMGSDNDISTYPWNEYRNDILEVVIGDGVTDIGPYAFAACTNLYSITIPDSITTIYENAFDNCMSLQSVRYTGEDYMYSSINIIDAGKVEITASETAEDGTVNETVIDVTPGNIFADTIVYYNCDMVHDHDYQITNTWTGFASGIKYSICSVCGDVSAIRIPATLNWSFENGVLSISGSGAIPDMTSEYTPWTDIKDQIKTIRIFKGITSIGANVFADCINLKEVDIFSDISYIGPGNFENSSGSLKVVCTISEEDFNSMEVDASDTAFINAEAEFHVLSENVYTNNRIESSCSQEGSYDCIMYCADCGKTLYTHHYIIGKTEHNWTDRKIVKEALEYECGEAVYTCSECGETKSVMLPTKHINNAEDGLMSTPLADGNYYYVENGYISSYTGMAENEAGIWYVSGGKVDTDFKGLILYQDAWHYISNGTFDNTYTGLSYNDYGWWYVNEGLVDFTYTGPVSYNDSLWLVKDGKVVFEYTGIAIYNGRAVKIVNGQFQ